MKKSSILCNLFLTAAFIFISYAAYDYWEYTKLLSRIEAINTRIEYLNQVEGYTILDAKHIADVEFGLVPKDAKYNALIKK